MNVERLAVLDDAATAAYAHLFQALADPTRLSIVQHLSAGEHRVRDLVDHMGLAQSTVSKHVGFLLECGLAAMRPEGRSTWYSLSDTPRLRRLIAVAEEMLDTTGNHFELCTHLRLPHEHSVPAALGQAALLAPHEERSPDRQTGEHARETDDR
ncbi:hypothetical protein GCM10025768_28000 [Microbacterium pseudoresistens]